MSSHITFSKGLKMIFRLPQVTARTGLSKASIYKYIKEGSFPAAKKLGIRSVGWLEADINSWIESRQSIKVS